MRQVWEKIKKEQIPSSLEFDFDILEFLPKGSRILDLGCGTGVLSRKLAQMGYKVCGIDCSVDGIQAATEADSHSSYSVMDASCLSFDSFSFDLVILKAVFTVVPKAITRKTIIEEASRVLKHGGYVYIADFAQTWHNPMYYQRYIENYSVADELGLFKVYDKYGQEEYTAKHFSQREIVDLYLDVSLELQQFDTVKVMTKSGNLIDGYKILLRKTSSGGNDDARI